MQLMLFWLSIAFINTAMPAVISVNPVNVSQSATVQVSKMPGKIVNIGMDLSGDWLPALLSGNYSVDLIAMSSSTPFFFEHLNSSIGLPRGYNGTVLFSTPTDASSTDLVLRDPYAQVLSVQCGVVPVANVGDYKEITMEYQRASKYARRNQATALCPISV